MNAPAIGTRYRISHGSHRGQRRPETVVEFIGEDAAIDPVYRYQIRVVESVGVGYSPLGHEFTVELPWFGVRGALWPREGGVQLAIGGVL